MFDGILFQVMTICDSVKIGKNNEKTIKDTESEFSMKLSGKLRNVEHLLGNHHCLNFLKTDEPSLLAFLFEIKSRRNCVRYSLKSNFITLL